MANNDESDDVFKLKRFRKMFLDYTKEFKVGVHKVTSGAATPGSDATTPPQTGSGKRLPKSSSLSSSEPLSDVGSGENVKGSKEGSNEKIADAKEFAKQDDEEFENDGGTGAMAHSKIRNRHLQWKGNDAEEKSKERKKMSDPHTPTKEANPYLTARGGKQSPYGSGISSTDLDAGIRKRRVRKKKNGDKSGGRSVKSSRSEKTEKRTSNQRRKAGSRHKTDEGAEAKSPGRRSSPMNTSPVKTDASSPAVESPNVESETAHTPTTPQKIDEKYDCADIDSNCADFKTAIRLMEILKRNNILENALFPSQNETLRGFFEGGMKNPERKIMELISKAMDFVLDAVFFKGEDMDCLIDNELKTFIVDRFKSKPMLLDVIISRPEFLPLSWGGRTVVLRHTEATVLVQPHKKDKK